LQFRNIANRLGSGCPRPKSSSIREVDGSCPFLAWFNELPAKVQDCYLRLEQLREMGHELPRPEADFLRDGIYELRVSLRGVSSPDPPRHTYQEG
jgi:hypothetical protein